MRKVLSCFVFLCFVFMASAQVAEADKVINGCASKLKSYRNVDVNFTFNLTNEKSKVNQTKSGSAMLSGNKFRLIMGGQNIVCDGKTVWTIINDAKEIQISSVEDSEMSSPLDIITNWNKLYKTKGVATKIVNKVDCNVVELVSIDAKKAEKVSIAINKKTGLPVSITVTDKSGSKYTYTMNTLKTDVPTDAKTFSVNPKEYSTFEVVDLR